MNPRPTEPRQAKPVSIPCAGGLHRECVTVTMAGTGVTREDGAELGALVACTCPCHQPLPPVTAA